MVKEKIAGRYFVQQISHGDEINLDLGPEKTNIDCDPILVHEDLTSDVRINKDGFNFHGIIREENSGFKNLEKEMEHNFITQSFTDEEWLASSDIIAFFLSCNLPEMNSNCLKLVESLSGLGVRIKELQKKVSLHLLLSSMGKKEFTDVKQIIDLLQGWTEHTASQKQHSRSKSPRWRPHNSHEEKHAVDHHFSQIEGRRKLEGGSSHGRRSPNLASSHLRKVDRGSYQRHGHALERSMYEREKWVPDVRGKELDPGFRGDQRVFPYRS